MDSVPPDTILQRHPSLRTVVEAAKDVPVSLVGGSVRDILIGRLDGVDVDVVVEGEAVPIARNAARELGADVATHERFGTAEIHLPGGGWIDLVSARSERYPQPGALPVVAPGTLDDDLARRDITVNAMAIRLNGPHAGEVVDPEGGRADLAERLVRALHAASFEDDPSRVLRVARYAARLGFAIEARTRAGAEAVAPLLDPTSARVGDELARTLQEPAAGPALRQAAQLGVPWIGSEHDIEARMAALDAAMTFDHAPHVPLWALRLGVALTPEALAADVAVPGWALAIARSVAQGPALAERLRGIATMSDVDEILRRMPPPATVAAAAAGADVVVAWWRANATLDLAVTGHDLIAAGVVPGPAIGAALMWLRGRMLDGADHPTAEAQLAVALDHIRRS